MKKNIILSMLAALLLVGGVILIAPMFTETAETRESTTGVATDSGSSGSFDGEFGIVPGAPSGESESGVKYATATYKPSGGEIVSFIASDEYDHLSAAQKREYRSNVVIAFSDPRTPPDEGAMRQGMQAMEGLSEEQRQKVENETRSMWRQVMEKRLENFFTLDSDEQTAIIDDRIDRMVEHENRMKAWMEENPDDPHVQRIRSHMSGSGGADARSDDRVNRGMMWRQSISPASRARMTEVGRMMEARRKERGLPESMFGRMWGHR
jgi:hypothetical protein